jgi:hypothetical protein
MIVIFKVISYSYTFMYIYTHLLYNSQTIRAMLPNDRNIMSQFSNSGGIPILNNASGFCNPNNAIKKIIAKTINNIISSNTLRLSPING